METTVPHTIHHSDESHRVLKNCWKMSELQSLEDEGIDEVRDCDK